MLLFTFAVIIPLFGVNANDLPPYISQCSLSDPNINRCIVEKANLVIPRIAKGDINLAIPTITPIHISECLEQGDGFEMILFDCYTDDMKDFVLTNTVFTTNGLGSYEGYINHYAVIAKDYKIVSGKILGFPVSGSGKVNFILVGVTLNVTADIQTYTKRCETYLDVRQVEVRSNVKRAYYYFENLKSPLKGDFNAYLEQNWRNFTDQLTPAINAYLSAFTNYAIHGITTRFPLNKIFLP